MTTSIWDEVVARCDSAADEQDDEPVRDLDCGVVTMLERIGAIKGVRYDPDYDRPTYDEWRRDEDARREHDETRHAAMRSYGSYGY